MWAVSTEAEIPQGVAMKAYRRHFVTCTLSSFFFLSSLALGLATSSVAAAHDDDDDDDDDDDHDDDGDFCALQTPDSFDGFLVFVADGEIPVNEPPAAAASTFFTNVMCWDEVEFADWKAGRFDILEARFGLDLAAAEAALNLNSVIYADNDLFIQVVETNPGLNYRAVAVGDREVPPEGWTNREGAIQVVVTNPNGLDLGGDFAGQHVPPGTFFAGGIYNVEVTDEDGPTGEELVLNFVSSRPIVPEPDFTFAFFCELDSELFSNGGLAQGTAQLPVVIREGVPFLKANFRNILTFSEDAGL